jgi:hypothetical protein
MVAASLGSRLGCSLRRGRSFRRRPPTSSAIVRHALVMLVVAFTAFASLFIAGLAGVTNAGAAVAPAAAQCDPPAFPTGAGQEVSCNITIANTLTSTGATSSTITATACLAVAGVLPPAGCNTVTTTSGQLVTTVDQCNGVVNGGGSNVTCSVSVINTIPTGTNLVGVTVNQCIGTGAGGGTAPTTVCAPVASTSGATVTQCNGSANGGGGSMRAKCTETGGATALPITINQCNGSSDGGGSTVTCATTFTNNFVASAPATTPTPTPTPTGTPAPTATPTAPGKVGVTAPTTAKAPGTGSGATGKTGSAAAVGGSTRSVLGTLGFVPAGAPQTGFGGEAHSSHHTLILFGSGLLIIAGLALALVMRRRRTHGGPIADDNA